MTQKTSLTQQSDIRNTIRRLRNALPNETHIQHGKSAANLFFEWLENCRVLNAQQTPLKIGVFLSQDGELSTSELIQKLWHSDNFEVYLPVIYADNSRPMTFSQYTETTDFEINHFKMRQPKLTDLQPRVSAMNLDLVMTPLVAFDQHGYRIGMGGGYYDRSFAGKDPHHPPLLIGWAHNCQKVDSIEKNDWDVPLDWAITEKQWFEFK